MKANEAPERIWINSPQDLPCGFVDSNSVEYIRKDAFIEKACSWLKENITNNPNVTKVIGRKGCVTMGMLIKDFKKAMEE